MSIPILPVVLTLHHQSSHCDQYLNIIHLGLVPSVPDSSNNAIAPKYWRPFIVPAGDLNAGSSLVSPNIHLPSRSHPEDGSNHVDQAWLHPPPVTSNKGNVTLLPFHIVPHIFSNTFTSFISMSKGCYIVI